MRVAVAALPADQAERHLGELADILIDAVRGGASVNFLDGITRAQAETFWRRQLPGLAAGQQRLLVARAESAAGTGEDARLLGTVLLSFALETYDPEQLISS